MHQLRWLYIVVFSVFAVGMGACHEKRSAPLKSDSPIADEAAPPVEEEAPPVESPPIAEPPPRFIYVASGACYGGDATAGATSAGSNTVSRYDLDSGAFDSLIVDYNSLGFGDAPAGIVDFDADHLLVLIENTGGRRIDLLDKRDGSTQTYLTNSNLNGVARSILRTPDGGFLISKTTAVERFNANKNRIGIGANPFVNNPAGNCGTSNVRITSVAQMPSGKIVFSHANTSPNKKIAVISASGYAAPADCLAGVTIPTTTALPTALLLESSSGHLLVAAGSSTTTSNFVQSYVVSDSTGAISAPVPAWNDFAYVSAPSAMIQDPAGSYIYVASARSSYNSIERFTYDANTRLLSRDTPTYIQNSLYTRCVAGLSIGN